MSWASVRGHDRHVDAFTRAFNSGRLAHAFLFTGPNGVGKKLFAVQLAKTLLCERRRERFDSCDQCASCHIVDAGNHPDLVVVGKPPDKLEFPIDVMRELVATLSLKPARGDRRVAVLDDADDLNAESANCFLKTLEEPAPGSLLILVGVDIDRQLATIRSRCQKICFDPLPPEIVKHLLRDAGIEPGLAAQLVRIADGSPGVARDLADADLWAFRQSCQDELLRPKPNGPALAKRWMELVEAAGKESAAQRHRAGLVLLLVVDVLREALASALAGDKGNAIAVKFGPDNLLDKLERCLAAEAHIDRRVQLVLLVEAVVDALMLDAPAPLARAWSA